MNIFHQNFIPLGYPNIPKSRPYHLPPLITFYTIWAVFSSKQGGVTHSRVGIKAWHFTYFANRVPGRFNVKKKKKIPAPSSFAATDSEGCFRKNLTQVFGFDYCSCYHTLIFEKKTSDLIAPKFNAESLETNLKCQKSKTTFIQGIILRFSNLTCQWR